MSTITRERAQEIFLGNGPEPTALEERELARIALASLEAQEVASSDLGAVKFEYTGAGDYYGYGFYRDGVQVDVDISKPLYTAPPAPVSVPAEVGWEDVPEDITEDDMEVALAWAHGFNQCRAAMLQGADGNSPVIPDGWVACSERLPPEGYETDGGAVCYLVWHKNEVECGP